MDLQMLIQEFLEYLEIERNVSKLTVRNYKHYLQRFLGFLAGQSPTPSIKISSVNSESIRRFRLYLSRFSDERGMTLKRVTQNYHLIAIRSFLKYLAKRDIQSVSADKIDLPKAESHSIKFLERDQIERLLNMPQIGQIGDFTVRNLKSRHT